MTAIRRMSNFTWDFGRLWRETGPCAALRLLKERIFERTDNLLYEFRACGVEHGLPADWSVKRVRSETGPEIEHLRRSGGDLNLHNFRRGAVAYVLTIGDEAVGHSWYFPESLLARRLGHGAIYLGNIFVRPEWRGKGVNGHLLKFMASQFPSSSRIVMEIEHSNATCQKSMTRAGCVRVGQLSSIVFLGTLVKARITP